MSVMTAQFGDNESCPVDCTFERDGRVYVTAWNFAAEYIGGAGTFGWRLSRNADHQYPAPTTIFVRYARRLFLEPQSALWDATDAMHEPRD